MKSLLSMANRRNRSRRCLRRRAPLHRSLAVVIVASLACHLQDYVTSHCQAQQTGHWVQLFDGESLFGWHATSTANWRVEDGAIVVSHGPTGFLTTQVEFGDFELQLEFRAQRGTNSGVFVRSASEPRAPDRDCYEINIVGADNPFPTGSIVGRARFPIEQPLLDDWRTMCIIAQQDRITVSVDGGTLGQYVDPQPRLRGRIALQFNTGEIAFRALRLRPLGMQPMFDGCSLDGWRPMPDRAGSFEVEQGTIRIRGGPGQLETTQLYDDFLLQLEARTNVANANSGVFFRCIPGDQMMGYESQIQHGFRDQDRTKPTDGGTGALFRRQNARRVVANDKEWFKKTIVASGNQFAVWVNGDLVTCWLDDRPHHSNPRQGLRLEAGSIILQAHDPEMDVSFRNLGIFALGR